MSGEWKKKVGEILEKIKPSLADQQQKLGDKEKDNEQFNSEIFEPLKQFEAPYRGERVEDPMHEPERIYIEKERNLFRELTELLNKICPNNDFTININEKLSNLSEAPAPIARLILDNMLSDILERILRELENDPGLAKEYEFKSGSLEDKFKDYIKDFSQADTISKHYPEILQCSLRYLHFLNAKEKNTKKVQTEADNDKNTRSLCNCISEIVCQLVKSKSLERVHGYIADQINKYLVSNEILARAVIDQIIIEKDKPNNIDFYRYGQKLYRREQYKLAYIVLKQINQDDSEIDLSALCDTYNTIGLCAIEEEDYCRALEEYCAFLKSARITRALLTDKERKQMSIIYNNLSYVLGALSDRTDGGSIELKRALVNVAINMINKAIELDNNSKDFFCTCGTLYSDKAEITEDARKKKTLLEASVDNYKRYYSMIVEPDFAEKHDALRMLLDTKLDLLRLCVLRRIDDNNETEPDNFDLTEGENHNEKLEKEYKEVLDHIRDMTGEENRNDKLENEYKEVFDCISEAKNDKAFVEEWSFYGKYILASELELDNSIESASPDSWGVFYAFIAVASLIVKLRSKLLHPVESKKPSQILNIPEIIKTINNYNKILGLDKEINPPEESTIDRIVEADENDDANEKDKDYIVYYTSISNFLNLFKTLYQADGIDPNIQYPLSLEELKEKSKDLISKKIFTEEKIEDQVKRGGKNCFTVMNTNYMNDPTEGQKLLKYLFDLASTDLDSKTGLDKDGRIKAISVLLGDAPEQFRDRLLTDKFAFIKSFSASYDQLTMWSMYGGDRKNSGDSNGVCVRVNPETFSSLNTSSAKRDYDKGKTSKVKMKRTEDDFRLYSIAYLGECDTVSVENGNSADIKSLLKMLYIFSEYLGEKIMTFEKKKREAVRTAYGDELEKIAFLFKDASYSQEKEFRMVLFREMNEQDMKSVCTIPGTPAKLCLKPYFQVYLDEIILGPKFNEADTWIPYFQMEINKINLIAEKNDISTKRSVKKSSIPYR